MVGLKDPCRPGVRTAVDACRRAGVAVKMIAGDNLHIARAIALECGILRADQDLNEVVIEGQEFRSLTTEQMMAIVDKISVMARSSPFDKLLMVKSLK
ncbi:putative calcium-transporting ATPase 13, plasma membrane-type [Asimina triloba]